MSWYYQKLNDDLTIKYCPSDDLDGSITGKCIYGLRAWFDENPEERKRLGWIKHIKASKKNVQYDNQTQFLLKSTIMVDEYTVQDVYHVLDKTEEMMALEETQNVHPIYDGVIIIYGDDFDE